MGSRATGVGVALAWLLSGCVQHHDVRLVTAGASLNEAAYVCSPDGGCAAADRLVQSDDNRAGTVFVTLPGADQCKDGRLAPIVLLDQPGKPIVQVSCDAQERPKFCFVDPRASPGKASLPNCTEDILVIENETGHVAVSLPAECGHAFGQVVIHDVRSSAPSVEVQCAVPLNDLPPRPAAYSPAPSP